MELVIQPSKVLISSRFSLYLLNKQRFIQDENGNEKLFKWVTRNAMSEDGIEVKKFELSKQIDFRYRGILIDMNHYSLKNCQMDQIWSRHGFLYLRRR